ncbi:MAG TPA: VWA domain-containing protein [Anaerolineales bacterium]|nr:VWA domain-containing protein [Anaerolineales bacterium]
MSLGLYFTVLDAGGQVLTDVQVIDAEVAMEDGSTYDAAVAKPSPETYVVLALDGSGSMVGSINQLRQAAVQAVQAAPEGASFAVIQFNNRVTILQDFTSDKTKVEEAINKVRAVQNAGTCLYDAAYASAGMLQGAPRGRRAMILFTDGDDELPNGRPCSQHTFEEVVALASRQEARVPIHTIGLRTSSTSPVNEALLRELSSLTGGTAQAGAMNSLSLLFTTIVRTLSSQWLASAEVYPQAGENRVVLTVWLEEGPSVRSDPVTIVSSRDYVAPPSARVESVTYTNTGNLNLHLGLNKPEQIASLELQVTDTESNVAAPPFNVEPAEIVSVPASAFKSGNAYRISIRVLDQAGRALWETAYDFSYDPTIVEGQLQVVSVELDPEAPEFVVALAAQNLEGVDHYELWLNDTVKKTVVPGSKVSVPVEGTVHLPLADVPGGTYDIIVTAVSQDGVVLAQTEFADAVFRVSLFTRIARVVRSYFWVPLCVGLVFLISAAFLFKVLVLDPRRRKGTGVLIESTVIRRGGGLESMDDWSEDKMRLNKRRLRAESSAKAEAPPAGARPAGAVPAPIQVPPPVAAVPALPAARLELLATPDGANRGRVYPVHAVPFTIGRAGNTLDLAYNGVSRSHAALTYRGGQFFLRDVGSTNGTLINGESIVGRGEVPVPGGAEVSVGLGVVLRFVVD